MANAWFDATLHLAAKFAGRGDHADAITVMVPWASWNLEPFENTILAYNLAQMFAQLQQIDEAVAWCDWGLEFERPLRRTLVAEHRAAILHGAGRVDDAVAAWRELQSSGLLDDAGRARVDANLRVALGADR
jgi:predicted negative regulator of RcsB-dependent stress response